MKAQSIEPAVVATGRNRDAETGSNPTVVQSQPATGCWPSPPGLATGPVRRTNQAADRLGGQAVPANTMEILRRRRGAGQPLSEQIATPMGNELGVDLSDVRVHNDAEAHAVSQSLQARAFTHGTDIYFGQGAFSPGSATGQRVLAHELAHVAQQTDLSATGSSAVVGRADDPAEAQADRVADAVLRRLRNSTAAPDQTLPTPGNRPASGATIRFDALRRMSAAVEQRTAAAPEITRGFGQPRPTLGVLRTPSAFGVIRREADINSMDAAWGEMTAKVHGLNVQAFIERLRHAGTVDDGGDGFSWKDFLEVIGTEEGNNWVKDKWRDISGQKWGEDQEIQGQHEWIKTDFVAYVIRTVALNHKGVQLDAWLAACDMLRIPTSEVLFEPRITPAKVAQVNAAPADFTVSTVGGFSGHPGAVHAKRTTPHAKDPQRYANRPLTTGEKAKFHNPMDKLLEAHLDSTKNDLLGFLKAIAAFQTGSTWGGAIPDLDESAARQIPNDLYAGQTDTAGLYGSYSTAYAEGVGITTTFTEAATLFDFQQIALEAKERNKGIMDRRVNALVQFVKPPSISPSSQWGSLPMEPAYVVDSHGKTTEDYDNEAGYNSMDLAPNPHAMYDAIADDLEPDEDYTIAPDRPSRSTTAQPQQPLPQKILDDYGQARSGLHQQQEAKIESIRVEVERLFGLAYQAEKKALEKRVDEFVGKIDPTDPQFEARRARIHQKARTRLQGIDDKYKAEGERLFTQYIDQKRRRDVQLFAEHPLQLTFEGLNTLLETYMADTTQLLDAYVADVKNTLKIT